MMLKTLIYVSLVGALAAGNPDTERPAGNAILLTLPKLDWVLEVGGTDLIVERKETSPDGKNARFMAVDRTTGILISGFLEDQGRPATAEQCRDFYWAKAKDSPLQKDDITQSTFGNMALVEFIVKEHEGVKTNQKHVNAYLTRGNFWIDVHLSKMHFKEGERASFNTVLRNVKLSSREPGRKVRTCYRITNQMALSLDIPPGWSDEIRPASSEAPPEIRMTPRPHGSPQVLITVLPLKQDPPDSERLPLIRRMVENAGKEALPQAVEKALDIRPFQGKSSAGCLFTLTDKAPKPDEFKYLTQGGYGIDKLILLFTILSNETDSQVSKLALEMVGNARAVMDKPRRAPAP